MKLQRSVALATFGAAALTAAALAPAANAEMKHEGITVNILTRPGPVIAGRLEERGEEFKAMTGPPSRSRASRSPTSSRSC